MASTLGVDPADREPPPAEACCPPLPTAGRIWVKSTAPLALVCVSRSRSRGKRFKSFSSGPTEGIGQRRCPLGTDCTGGEGQRPLSRFDLQQP